jgi:DNA-binding response OmpR family regulator
MAATVLVVEDERKLRDLVRSYLERAGFTVLSTGSGAEAITMAAAAAPDLVVLDLGLPDVPGEAVARELRVGSTTPILMLTAKSAEEDRIRGLELGADDYVTKPFSPRELVLRVQAILRRGGPPAAQGVTSYGGGELVIDEPQRLARRPCDLADLAAVAADSLARRFEAAGLTLDRRLAASPVLADPHWLHQVITNLLTNALKFTPAGGHVTISTGPSGADAILRVTDTGTGIPADDLPRIFDRFWRGQRAAQVSGSGIGLAVAAELAQAHGGRLTAHSEPEHGTEMTLTLPRAQTRGLLHIITVAASRRLQNARLC